MADEHPTEETVTAWARLIRARHLVVAGVEKDVKAAGLPPLEWYDVLLELSRAPERGLRPYELEERLLLAQYNLSRLVDRLQQAGLVEKRACPSDRRGFELRITQEGLDLRTRTWPAYAAAIQRQFGSKLAPGDAETLGDILARLVDPKFGGSCSNAADRTQDGLGERSACSTAEAKRV